MFSSRKSKGDEPESSSKGLKKAFKGLSLGSKAGPTKTAQSTSGTPIYASLPLLAPMSIRLLTILPGGQRDPLKTTLHVATLPAKAESKAFLAFLRENDDPRSLEDVMWYLKDKEPLQALASELKYNGAMAIDLRYKSKLENENDAMSYLLSLQHKPDYEALSYVWGPPTPRVEIICDGQPFSVTSNLGSALRGLRKKDEPRTMWIDAICINQNDLDERIHQVAFMGEIYSFAEEVMIWLGEDDGKLSKGLNLVQIIAQHCREITGEGRPHTLDIERAVEGRLKGKTNVPPLKDAAWKGAKKLFNCQWFTRVWVAQELRRAARATVVVGQHSAPWDDLALCANWMLAKDIDLTGDDDEDLFSFYRAIRLEHIRIDRNFSLKDFLGMVRGPVSQFRATDPRDKVYAVLGMAKEGEELDAYPLLRIDYRRSLAEVYGDAVRHLLTTPLGSDQEPITLRVLDKELIDEEGLQKLPSWIPRWDYTKQWIPMFGVPLSKNWDASKGSTATLKGRDSPNTLTLKGFELAKISVSVPMKILDNAEALGKIFGVFQDMMTIEEGEKRQKNDFAATITAAGAKKDTPNSPPVPFDDTDFDEYLKRGKKSTKGKKFGDSINKNLTLFMTNYEQLGIGHPALEEGDRVCILYGGKYPYVLRPVGECFELIGQCYLHGWMDGMAMKLLGDEQAHLEEQWFELQ